MLHPYQFLLILIPFCFCINEPTNFDYKEHGANWDNCPKNGILLAYVGSNQSPI